MSAELKVGIGVDDKGLKKGLKDAEKGVKDFSEGSEKNLNKFNEAATSAFKGLAAFASAGAIISLGRDVLNTTAEFEKFGAVLANTLGSKGLAQLKMQQIQEFAAKTPFGVKELTESFVKLANQGFKPTGDEMRKLGDLASSTGKSFDQLAEAILDAQTGEFERLKEFGVRAQDAGNKVIFTFKGVQTTVDKTSESIRNYVTSLGDAEGVSGSMNVISKTLTGQISNLGDSWDQMLLSVGNNTSGVFTAAIGVMDAALKKLTEYNKKLELSSKTGIQGSGALSLTETTGDINLKTLSELNDKLAKGNIEFIEGAKSVKAYNDRIKELAKEANGILANMPIGFKDVLDGKGKGLAASIKKTYEDAIQQLKDGAKAFIAEREKILANAPKAGPARLKDLPDLPFIGQETVENRAFGTSSVPLLDSKPITPPAINFGPMKESLDFMAQSMIDFNEMVNAIIENGIISSFSDLGASIGEALASGGNVIEAAGLSLLSSLGSLLVQLGQAAIKTGVTLLAIKIALDTLNPFVAIAAGVALVALGSAMKGAVKGMGASMGGGGGVSSPSAPGSGFEPRAVAYAGGQASNVFIPSMTIKGQDLVTVFNRTNSLNGRMGK